MISFGSKYDDYTSVLRVNESVIMSINTKYFIKNIN